MEEELLVPRLPPKKGMILVQKEDGDDTSLLFTIITLVVRNVQYDKLLSAVYLDSRATSRQRK